MGKYDDIIDYEYHGSTRRVMLSPEQRAAQFSPFAALVGYDDCLFEETRLTTEQLILDDDKKKELDYILSEISDEAVVAVTYFVPDPTKAGGSYQTSTGRITRIDRRRGLIVLSDGTEIRMDDIADIAEQEPD